ncbi:serine/threonine-protein kinase [Modestobacter sp. I12A-02662]|uniref:serine/threonine-protein kinase n=1 Tax=Modestobacter sp. I12A-02662 TaxID=1730496 RepID=UPI0034DF4020
MAGDGGGHGRFGGYRLLDVLQDGDTDQLVRAHDPALGRDVALRVLAPRPGRRERFLRELPVVLRLTEPHLVRVHRYGDVGGRLFVATELVEGEHLADVLARTGPFDPARAVDVVGQLARALDVVHAAGLVHRDVGASSVLVRARPTGADGDAVLLADLGTAPGAGRDPEHPAPELAGGGPGDARADVHALAGLLFELLTGARPGDGAGPPAPSALRQGLPPELDGVVQRGLAADPEQRWTSAGGMAAAARAALALSGVEVARPPDGAAATTGDPAPAPRPPVLAGAAALLAVLAAAVLRRRRGTGRRR